jgi:ABC-type nickel/cobalt efflux system permease component RcnA
MRPTQQSRFQIVRQGNILLAKFLVVLVMLFHSWGAYANISSSSHDPANWSGHHSTLEAGPEHHEHSHDDPDPQDHGAGHQHVHNAADHSHEKSSLPRNVAAASATLKEVWSTVLRVPIHPAPCFAFERPPKHLPIN